MSVLDPASNFSVTCAKCNNSFATTVFCQSQTFTFHTTSQAPFKFNSNIVSSPVSSKDNCFKTHWLRFIWGWAGAKNEDIHSVWEWVCESLKSSIITVASLHDSLISLTIKDHHHYFSYVGNSVFMDIIYIYNLYLWQDIIMQNWRGIQSFNIIFYTFFDIKSTTFLSTVLAQSFDYFW